jgi:hypothetical protein
MKKTTKMEKAIITAKGIGTGKDKRIEVLTKDNILSLVENLDETQVLKKAWEGFCKGCKDGYAVINLKTGELQTESLGSNERNQAIDNQYIIIYTFDMNFDIGDYQLIIDETEEEEEEALFDYILYSPQEIINVNNIKEQLEFFYSDEEPI